MEGHKYICCECIDDLVLKKKIAEENCIALCSYCGRSNLAIQFERLADLVDTAYRACFVPAELNEALFDDDLDYVGSFPDEIINMMIGVDVHDKGYDIGHDLCGYLASKEERAVQQGDIPMYDLGQGYTRVDINDGSHRMLWEEFCQDIKHESRFFSIFASDLLNGIFSRIREYHVDGKFLLREVPVTSVWRARRAKTLAEHKQIIHDPDTQLGAPPSELAQAGRMNAQGISVFYGALDRDTCLAELRLAAGERVVIGEFSIDQPIKVLDFTMLEQISHQPSYFDDGVIERLSQIEFLKSFQKIISKPILPGSEPLEYLPTQAMTEYLIRYFGIDAIIFKSSQSDGNNIVVFVAQSKAVVSDDSAFISFAQRNHRPILIHNSIHGLKVTGVTYNTKPFDLVQNEDESGD